MLEVIGYHTRKTLEAMHLDRVGGNAVGGPWLSQEWQCVGSTCCWAFNIEPGMDENLLKVRPI